MKSGKPNFSCSNKIRFYTFGKRNSNLFFGVILVEKIT